MRLVRTGRHSWKSKAAMTAAKRRKNEEEGEEEEIEEIPRKALRVIFGEEGLLCRILGFIYGGRSGAMPSWPRGSLAAIACRKFFEAGRRRADRALLLAALRRTRTPLGSSTPTTRVKVWCRRRTRAERARSRGTQDWRRRATPIPLTET